MNDVILSDNGPCGVQVNSTQVKRKLNVTHLRQLALTPWCIYELTHQGTAQVRGRSLVSTIALFCLRCLNTLNNFINFQRV